MANMANKVKSENYIHIPGWAVCELGLKGNELLIYSIIFGFSQAENQTFRGSLKYLADWTNSSKRAVMNNLKSLESKGLIKKIERFVNGVKFCDYYATRSRVDQNDAPKFTSMEKSSLGGMEKSSPPMEKSSPHNIEENIDIYISSNKERNTKERKANKDKENRLTNKVLTDEFESIWNTYPNKKGKPDALSAYIKNRKEGTTYDEVKKGVENLNKEIRAKRTELRFIKHGSTWFRNKCWLDEYDVNDGASYNIDEYEKTMDTFSDNPKNKLLGIWL